ncbi:MAG TPA: dephospho-CoA kinase [Bacillales bacterium]|nr:dephospho-CoA kinase [Bacillales bacterium]
MLEIGLTGGIASGKSTVSRMLEDLGFPVIDADHYAREVVEPGEAAYEKIVAHFGEGVLHSDGTVDRKQLGAVIFNNDMQRKALNAIVHPEVRKKMNAEKDRYRRKQVPAVVLDIPLLFESRLTKTVDKVLLVYVDEVVQLKRLRKRDGSTEEEALSRIRAQIPLRDKKKLADAVIDNNGTVEETKSQLIEILRSWNLRA